MPFLRIASAGAVLAVAAAQFSWQEKWFTANIDNFNGWGSTGPDSSTANYQMRYLINDTWWKGPDSPVFFYTGNEGDITLFAQNTGLMWELAPTYGALLVFGEHRRVLRVCLRHAGNNELAILCGRARPIIGG